MRGLRAAMVWGALAWAAPAAAQDFSAVPLQPAQSPIGIVVVDMDRLFTQSKYGAQVNGLINARRSELNAENLKLEAELEAEEEALAALRPSLDPTEFRAKADAFDDKVKAIRAERDAQQRILNELIEASQTRFVDAVYPLLARLMTERGAMILFERPVVGLVDPSLDITDVAIIAVDDQLSGGALQVPAVDE